MYHRIFSQNEFSLTILYLLSYYVDNRDPQYNLKLESTEKEEKEEKEVIEGEENFQSQDYSNQDQYQCCKVQVQIYEGY